MPFGPDLEYLTGFREQVVAREEKILIKFGFDKNLVLIKYRKTKKTYLHNKQN